MDVCWNTYSVQIFFPRASNELQQPTIASNFRTKVCSPMLRTLATFRLDYDYDYEYAFPAARLEGEHFRSARYRT